MAYPEPRNLDDIYGPGAENADDGIDSEIIERRLAAALKMLERADQPTRTISDAGIAIGALIITLSYLIEIIQAQQAEIKLLRDLHS